MIVLCELGWWKLSTRGEFCMLKYWVRLCLMDDNRLPRKVYLLSRRQYLEGSQNWCGNIEKILNKYDLALLWLDEHKVKYPDPEELKGCNIGKYWRS